MTTNSRIGPETRARITAAWPAILGAMANGELVREVLARHKISDGEKQAYLLTEPNARAEWNTAREASADAFLEEVLRTVNSPTNDSAHARTKVDALKWAARIRNPRLYGDRAALDVTVRSVDLTKIIEQANARLIASRVGQRIIEGEATRIQEERAKMLE